MKLLIAAALVIITAGSYGQSYEVKAGLNLSNAIMKDNSGRYDENFKMKPGFHLGATAEFPINRTFAFETGLLLSMKGIKESFSESGYTTTKKTNLYYLDLPLTLKAWHKVKHIRVYGLIGPYIGIGLYGKSKSETTGAPNEMYTIAWGSNPENDDLKRLDMGLTFGAGIDLNPFQAGLSYNLGLINISPNTADNFRINNRVISLSAGYRFGRNYKKKLHPRF